MPFHSEPEDNRLLGALPDAEILHWLPHLKQVSLRAGDVLHESGSVPSHVVFPTTSVVSLMHLMRNGATAEVASVGYEGLVGVSLIMGGGSMPDRAVVRNDGEGLSMTAASIRGMASRPTVMPLLMRYIQALVTQTSQGAACNRHHRIEQQLSRWLLDSLDRLQRPDIWVTQEQIAQFLGVRREGVTKSTVTLQSAGLISCSRGHILVLDRAGLERRACECYAVVRNEFKRLMPKCVYRERIADQDQHDVKISTNPVAIAQYEFGAGGLARLPIGRARTAYESRCNTSLSNPAVAAKGSATRYRTHAANR